MILLDTNVFIYLANGTIAVNKLKKDDIAYPSIAKIEALGYAQITVGEQSYLEALLNECTQIDLTENIVQAAINLRQQNKISLGDAIVAATALVYDCELWTANTQDFQNISDLKLVDPLSL